MERQREEGRAAARERWLVGAKAAAEDAASAAAATVTVITTAFAANLASSPSATDLTAAVNAGDADAAAAAAAASAVAVACGTPMMAPLRLGDAALYQSRITLLAGPDKKCSIHITGCMLRPTQVGFGIRATFWVDSRRGGGRVGSASRSKSFG